MALTKEKIRITRYTENGQVKTRNFNVAAATTIWAGAIVGLDTATGLAVLPSAATRRTVGIARNTVQNPGVAATTNFPLIVEYGQVEEFPFVASPQDVGRVMVATADDVVALSAAPTALNVLGRIADIISSTTVAIEVELPQGGA